MNSKLFSLFAVTLLMLPLSIRAEVLPDPTRPAAFQTATVIQDLPAELIDWTVSAIRISARDRSAIVNGRIVRIGETIGPARILEIQPAQVLLDYDNKRLAVKLFSDTTMRKPVAN
jgi:hypothetical protein